MTFEDIKFKVGIIQFENLQLNVDKTAIEANPSTHKIAEWIYNNFVPLEAEVIVKLAEKRIDKLWKKKVVYVNDECDDIVEDIEEEIDLLKQLINGLNYYQKNISKFSK